MWRLTLLKIQRASNGAINSAISIHRKGNNLNDIIHVNKESGATHDVDLTMFSYEWRVFCSPSMALAQTSVH
jgi:hypothetical protein